MAEQDLIPRALRAAKLEPALYEEVEADPNTLSQALTVVVAASICAGIGSIGQGGIGGLIAGLIGSVISWYVFAYFTFFIGTRILPEPQTSADHGELLRTLGFAQAPGVITVVGVVPFLTGIAFLVAGIWMLIATVIAVRQALDYESTGRAILVCVLGAIVRMALFALFIGIARTLQ